MPIWGNLCSSLSTLCSPTTVSCTSIRRFANRPYHRTQKFSCLYGVTSVHCSLLSIHRPLSHAQDRAICKSPLPQDAKTLMPIWGDLCSPFTALCSLFTDHCLMHQHRAICKSPLPQDAKILMPIWGNLCSLLTVHCSLTSAHCSLFTAH